MENTNTNTYYLEKALKNQLEVSMKNHLHTRNTQNKKV